MGKYRALSGTLGVVLSMAGCATMIRGTEQSLQLTSVPPGARAVIGSGQSCTTPCELHLSRSTSTVVTFSREGCDATMVSVFPTLAGAGVILGGVIDYGTGAVYNLQPNPVIANLRCVDNPTAPIAVHTPDLPPPVQVLPVSAPAQTLSERLTELREAYDKGLLSQEEYERKRDEAMSR